MQQLGVPKLQGSPFESNGYSAIGSENFGSGEHAKSLYHRFSYCGQGLLTVSAVMQASLYQLQLLSPDLQYEYGNDGQFQAYADSQMHLLQQVRPSSMLKWCHSCWQ